MQEMKKRGRPVGSEIDDSEILNAIADQIVENPKLRPTTAMRRIAPKASGAQIRRWQSKWSNRKSEFISSASCRQKQRRQRAMPCSSRDSISAEASAYRSLMKIAEEMQRQKEMINVPEHANAMRACTEALKSLGVNSIREYMELAKIVKRQTELQRLADSYLEPMRKLKELGVI